jgi:hypothetical protein
MDLERLILWSEIISNGRIFAAGSLDDFLPFRFRNMNRRETAQTEADGTHR